MTCLKDKTTPFWDNTLSEDERIDWLLANMTPQEKLLCLTSRGNDIPRLGIPGVRLGGEAAHGVEGRNDQNDFGAPDTTTSFPQPIGMSASWDQELIKAAGRVTGIEARVVYKRHPGHGLSRWAPTVDLERDPRWGRTEEGYGEDPFLTGKMASAYIQGMRGEDPYYILCAATLKHFYANNTEDGRGWKNASIDPRNREELYLEPFRRCITEGGASGVMAAYNRINGIPGMLNPELQNILKDRYGVMHVVSDGGATGLVVNKHHYYGCLADAVVNAIQAGCDGLSDNPELVRNAAQDAWELGILKEEDLDRALRNTYRVKLRLGVYDKEPCPYDGYGEADICSKESKEICAQLSRESVVLLKNEGNLLPLSKDGGSVAIIGPMADAWYQDWYGGEPPYRSTLKNGVETLLGREIPCREGYRQVVFHVDGLPVVMNEEKVLVLGEAGQEPEIFEWMEWAKDIVTLRSISNGLYVNARTDCEGLCSSETYPLAAERKDVMDWFVKEVLRPTIHEDGRVSFLDRFRIPVGVNGENVICALGTESGVEQTLFTMEVVKDGVAEAVELAAKQDRVILALGCNSMICAREEVDRDTIELAPHQKELLEKVCAVNPNTVVMILSNYPYSFSGLEKNAPAICWSATGSQDMGIAAAQILFGEEAPAGRLNMTWYANDADLSHIDDYDIIRGKRTYRYFDGEVLYPFGYGLSYTAFGYEAFSVTLKDPETILAVVTVENTGRVCGDEVVQLYVTPPKCRVERPAKQLIAFARVKKLAPGEKRTVTLEVPVKELYYYDTISESRIVLEGNYTFYVGRHCDDPIYMKNLFVPGVGTGKRDLSHWLKLDHFDDCTNVELVEGAYGTSAASVGMYDNKAVLTFRDCIIPAAECGKGTLRILLKSENPSKVTVYLDADVAAEFVGDTTTYEAKASFRENSLKDGTPSPASWPAVWADVALPLANLEKYAEGCSLTLRLEGDVKVTKLVIR